MSLIPNAKPMEGVRTISVAQAYELVEQNKYKQAADMCAEVLEHMPNNATAICLRAICRWRLHADVYDCLAEVRRAQEMAPDSAVVKRFLAQIMMSTDQHEEARALFEEVLAEQPRNVQAFLEYVDTHKAKDISPLVQSFIDGYNAPDLNDARKSNVGYALGKVFDDLKQPDQAMKYLIDANKLTGIAYKKDVQIKRLQDLDKHIATVKDERTTAKYDGPAPIFIVGVSRSGTTLIETILSRHPEITACGELEFARGLEEHLLKHAKTTINSTLGPFTMLDRLDQDVFQGANEAFLNNLKIRTRADFGRFTDKMPYNSHRLLFLSRIFPNAKFIYARRHPLDVGLSNFLKRFNPGLDYSFSLEGTGHFMRVVADIVEKQRQVLQAPILDVSYDLLVQDPETQVRRLLAFADLEWNDACLSPEQSERATVMTASRWQVRQPIYKTSSAKWKAYEKHLGPMIEAAGGWDWINHYVEETERLGQSN